MKIKMNTRLEKAGLFTDRYTSDYQAGGFGPFGGERGSIESTKLNTIGKIGAVAGAASAVVGLIAGLYSFGKTIAKDVQTVHQAYDDGRTIYEDNFDEDDIDETDED